MESSPSRKEVTHERIVATAARAIRRGGFNGVGVADIMREAGLTHGGFYAHFSSRNALLAEALERAGQDSAARVAQGTAARQARGASALRALVEGYLSDRHLGDIEAGCPVAALASEMPRQSAEVRESSAQRVRGLIAAVRRALPQGRTGRQRPGHRQPIGRCAATGPRPRRQRRGSGAAEGNAPGAAGAVRPPILRLNHPCVPCRHELAHKYDDHHGEILQPPP